eukprot:3510276-Pyramimonas_sp.AAC.1
MQRKFASRWQRATSLAQSQLLNMRLHMCESRTLAAGSSHWNTYLAVSSECVPFIADPRADHQRDSVAKIEDHYMTYP